MEEENEKEKIFEEQHEKYANIKDAAISKILIQQEKLKTLNYYFEKCQEINKELVSKKQKKLKQLNYEIHVLKDDEAKNEETLNNLLQKNNKISNYLQEKKEQYSIYEKDYNSYITTYIKDRTNLNQIYEWKYDIKKSCLDSKILPYKFTYSIDNAEKDVILQFKYNKFRDY